MKKQKIYRGENTDNINMPLCDRNGSPDESTISSRQKKAQAHLEIIISFILFTSVIFIFFMLIKPFSNTKEIPSETIQAIIITKMTEEIGKLSVIVDTDIDCYSLTEVTDDYGADFVEIQDPINPRKYTIFFSPIFFQSEISCLTRPGTDFNFGAYSIENLYTYPKINQLKTAYDLNYPELKNQLRIKNDFSFSFRTIDNSQINDLTPNNPKEPPIGVNVRAKEIPVQIINSQGEIQNLILNLRVW